MIRVVIVGIGGKMGQTLVAALSKEVDMRIVGGVECATHPMLGSMIGEGRVYSDLNDVIDRCDVVVEFASPEVTLKNIAIAALKNKPFICGTTAHNNLNEIYKFQFQIPLLMAANFSIGINAIYELLPNLLKLLSDFDIEIIEEHHRHKKDMPSGTAKRIAEIIQEAKGTKEPLKIHSIRAGEIVGEHRLIFVSSGERVEIMHQAINRNAFANGVIKAIHFIVNQKPGLYTMADVLNSHNRK
ncbi:MAG: 4-hydroxy-tetrahydrodipicolinate reductase [candidate division WOR-3 bacterium]